jgi:hypothetical protein
MQADHPLQSFELVVLELAARDERRLGEGRGVDVGVGGFSRGFCVVHSLLFLL